MLAERQRAHGLAASLPVVVVLDTDGEVAWCFRNPVAARWRSSDVGGGWRAFRYRGAMQWLARRASERLPRVGGGDGAVAAGSQRACADAAAERIALAPAALPWRVRVPACWERA